MKNFLSERNIAGILFIMVMVAFSFAHEDSKKRSNRYSSSFIPVSEGRTSTSAAATSDVHIFERKITELLSVK